MNEKINRLKEIRDQLVELLDSVDLEQATESVDRAADQLQYAIDELYVDPTRPTRPRSRKNNPGVYIEEP